MFFWCVSHTSGSPQKSKSMAEDAEFGEHRVVSLCILFAAFDEFLALLCICQHAPPGLRYSNQIGADVVTAKDEAG